MILLQLHLSPQTLNVQTQTNTTTCFSSPLSLPFQIPSLLQVTSYKSTSFKKWFFFFTSYFKYTNKEKNIHRLLRLNAFKNKTCNNLSSLVLNSKLKILTLEENLSFAIDFCN
jgi:hypothetical protein